MDKYSSNYRKYHSKNPAKQYLIQKFQEKISGIISTLDISTILDAGCGEGYNIQYLQSHLPQSNLQFTGVDLNDSSLKLAQESCPGINFIKENLLTLPFPQDTFDLVMGIEVLEHLEYPEKVLKNLLHISRQYVLLTVPNEPWFCIGNILSGKNISRWGNDLEHIQRWSFRSFVTMTRTHGSLRIATTSFPWSIVLLEKK